MNMLSLIISSPYKPNDDKMGAHIPDRNQKTTNTNKPTQKDVSEPIKMAPNKPRIMETIERIANIEPEAIGAASNGPLL